MAQHGVQSGARHRAPRGPGRASGRWPARARAALRETGFYAALIAGVVTAMALLQRLT